MNSLVFLERQTVLSTSLLLILSKSGSDTTIPAPCAQERTVLRGRAKIEHEVDANETAGCVRVSTGSLNDFDQLTVRQRKRGRGWRGPGGGRGRKYGHEG